MLKYVDILHANLVYFYIIKNPKNCIFVLDRYICVGL